MRGQDDPVGMIKYIGSKRVLVPAIMDAIGAGARAGDRPGTLLDLFSGTSRVGHAAKALGWRVVANDHNAYAHTLAACYVQADAQDVAARAQRIIAELNALPGRPGYFTQTFCERSRYVHPSNGERIDAMRERIERLGLDPELRAVVLTSLIEAADRVDSTVGVQMAYLKAWAPRALKPIELRVPDVLPRAASGKGAALMLDALECARRVEADVAYVDPPYNQHSYLGNYHVWETLVRWDSPSTYGTACKREDCKDRKSEFNSRARCLSALTQLLDAVRAPTVVVSFSDEGFVSREQMDGLLGARGEVRVVERDHPRYVGARIGIYNPSGEKVGRVGRLRNREFLFVMRRRLASAAA